MNLILAVTDMKALITISLLIVSNSFMTLAWYGHLKFAHWPAFTKFGLFGIVIISWGIAFFEYMAMIPANRIGYIGNDGPFSVWELKVIQEVVTLVIFSIFTLLIFKSEPFKTNHLIGFIFLILAVFFIFKK